MLNLSQPQTCPTNEMPRLKSNRAEAPASKKLTIPVAGWVFTFGTIKQFTCRNTAHNPSFSDWAGCGNSAFIPAQMTIMSGSRIMGGGRDRRAGKYEFVIRQYGRSI